MDDWLAISYLHEDGYGLRELDGRQVAVFGALPGERARVRFIRKRRQRVYAVAEEIADPSPDRVTSGCRHSDVCGGCAFQHLSPVGQLRYKQLWLGERLGGTSGDAGDPIDGPVAHYRTKARLGVRHVPKKGKVLVGFREKMNSFVAETVSCPVLHGSVSDAMPELSELVGSLECRARIPQIEVACGQAETALVLRVPAELTGRDRALLKAHAQRSHFSFHIQTGGPTTVEPLCGDAELHYDLDDHGLRIAFGPLEFTQVNRAINAKLVGKVLELLDLSSSDRVLDLFCGIGNFTLPVAARCSHVLGVEGSAVAIDRAQRNARANGIDNVQLTVMDLCTGDLTALARGAACDKVIIDPPRSGAHAVCEQLPATGVERIVYVSCGPTSFARDARLLVGAGFRLLDWRIADMFPHTIHSESIALFER